jgi:hypothetical protein
VWQTYAEAKRLGWLVTRPFRGDLVLFDFDGDGSRERPHRDRRPRPLDPVPGPLALRTVEGNTSSGRKAGSQADGGGVYVRTRLVAKKQRRVRPDPRQSPHERTPVKHLKHVLTAAAVVVAAVAPMVIANPSVQHYIAQHPAVAAYVPLATGIVRAVYKAIANRS